LWYLGRAAKKRKSKSGQGGRPQGGRRSVHSFHVFIQTNLETRPYWGSDILKGNVLKENLKQKKKKKKKSTKEKGKVSGLVQNLISQGKLQLNRGGKSSGGGGPNFGVW